MVTRSYQLLSFFFLLGKSRGAPQQGREVQTSAGCLDFADAGFHCVPIFQCDDEGIIKTDAGGLFDPRSTEDNCEDYVYADGECCPPEKKQALRASCPASLDVCCLHPNSTSQYSSSNLENHSCGPNGGPRVEDNGQDDDEEVNPECSVNNCRIFGIGCCVDQPEVCTEEDRLIGFCEEPSLGPTEPRCGTRNSFGTASVPDTPSADEAEFGEWPHVCALLKKEDIGGGAPLKIYQCGASLIDDQVLLTAAHCVKDIRPDELIVRCGEWNTQNEEESLPYQEIQVQEVKMHGDFVNANHHNNFAVLFVENAFEIQDHIQPVCLPQPCAIYDQKNCVANGWGKDKFGSDGRYSTILKEVTIPVVDSAKCQEQLRRTRLGEFFELDDSFICAGGIRGVDTCKGDGGSPLSCRMQGNNKWVQAGIVSWGIGCAEEEVPAVYANVGHVVCWIDNEVKKYFNTRESRFGFLPSVDCNGELPVKICSERFGERKHNNAIREAIIEDIFAAEDEEYDYIL